MLSALTLAIGWYASIQRTDLSEPVWFAAWGLSLIGAGMLIRSVGDRARSRA